MARGSNRGKRRVTFALRAEPNGEVFVAGTFNNWNPTEHRLEPNAEGNQYGTTLYLAKGAYEYKFVVNGVWCVDPECADWAPNDFGSLNSVLKVE